MIKGVIFDLDGVLVSTDEMHYQAWKRLADQLGIFGFTRKWHLWKSYWKKRIEFIRKRKK